MEEIVLDHSAAQIDAAIDKIEGITYSVDEINAAIEKIGNLNIEEINQTIEKVKNLFPSDPIDTVDTLECTQSGFYGFVNTNTPESDSGWGSLAVRRADTSDANGYISIEQIFYGRSNNNSGSIWTRLMFEKDGNIVFPLLPWSKRIGGSNELIPRNLQNTEEDNINTCYTTGFYGYVELNRPNDSSQWGSCSVSCSDKADNNGFISIEQTFYGRGNDTGKIWKRLNFYNINNKTFDISPWTLIGG